MFCRTLCMSQELLMVLLRKEYSTTASLPVITVPLAVQSKLKQIRHKQREERRARYKELSRGGAKEVPVITCKRPQYNHFKGQVYNKFKPLPLASGGWKNRQTAGDYFVIQTHGNNPALRTDENQPKDNNNPDNFASFGFSEEILQGLEKLNISKPTLIQKLAIPEILKKKHAICAAETGSGKTLAYLAPIMENILRQKIIDSDSTDENQSEFNSPKVLIILPSRELAEQIGSIAKELGRPASLRTKILTGGGGVGIKTLLNPQFHHVDVMVATLGVLKKLVHGGVYRVEQVKHLVIDEADTMTDDSFNESLVKFMKRFNFVSDERGKNPTQLCLVGATLPRDLKYTLQATIDTDTMVTLTTPYLHRLMPHVPQKFVKVKPSHKPETLLEILKNDLKKEKPIMIFCKNRPTADYVSIILDENKIANISLNGKLSSKHRSGRFNKFQNGDVDVIVCTDIASRGLDTRRVQHVINYDFPTFMSDYIHRVGRTGRVGSVTTGHVTSFITYRYEVELLQKLETAARKADYLPNVNANIRRKLDSMSPPMVADAAEDKITSEDVFSTEELTDETRS